MRALMTTTTSKIFKTPVQTLLHSFRMAKWHLNYITNYQNIWYALMQGLASSALAPTHSTYLHTSQTFMLSAVFLMWCIALFPHCGRAAALTLHYHSKDLPCTAVSFKCTANIQQQRPSAASPEEAGLYTSSSHCLQGTLLETVNSCRRWRKRLVKKVLTW